MHSCAQRLDALVTKPGEKCGLSGQDEERLLFVLVHDIVVEI